MLVFIQQAMLGAKAKICVFQVTRNFKIGTGGWTIFLFCLKFLYEVNRKKYGRTGKSPKKPLGSVEKK